MPGGNYIRPSPSLCGLVSFFDGYDTASRCTGICLVALSLKLDVLLYRVGDGLLHLRPAEIALMATYRHASRLARL